MQRKETQSDLDRKYETPIGKFTMSDQHFISPYSITALLILRSRE